MHKIMITFLIFSFYLSSCVSPVYNIHQVMEKEYISRKLIKKRVLIIQKNDERIEGYLKSITSDSLTIILTNSSEIIAEKKIATENVKTIMKKKRGNPAVAIGVLSVVTLAIVLLGCIGSALSSVGV